MERGAQAWPSYSREQHPSPNVVVPSSHLRRPIQPLAHLAFPRADACRKDACKEAVACLSGKPLRYETRLYASYRAEKGTIHRI